MSTSSAFKNLHTKPLTKEQISLFWKAFAAACSNLGLTDRQEQEDYRHEVMLVEAGKTSLKELNRTTDLDACLRRFRADAANYADAIDASLQDAKRLAYLIKVICCQIMQLKGGDEASARSYLCGLLDQARIINGRSLDDDGIWLDLDINNAKKVFAMLDTHRRRMLRRWQSSSRFSPRVRYTVDGPIVIREEIPSSYYSAVPFKVNWIASAVTD